MIYTTISTKSVICPKYNESLLLSGKYKLTQDSYEATFMYATCPVVENCKLPYHKQNKDLALLYCNDSLNCSLLKDFKAKINISIDGYSQK